ncbi:putative disease resistance protein rga1, partial [Quercus suber]
STMAREIVSSMTEGIVSSMTGEIVNDVRRLRTFVSKNVVLRNTLLNFICLRVLKLNGDSIKELPSSIGLLIHLRLLSVASFSIKALPKSITKLYILQTLRIEGCPYVREALEDLKQLINLRHIYIPSGFNEKLKDIGQLTCLQTLRCFIVGQDAGHRIEELGCLNQLRGKLDLWNLEHRKGNYENDEEVLEGLEPHRCLKSLTIDGFGEKKFPSWMLTSLDAWDGILQFGNLIEIEFRNCKKCEVLPTLGLLPHLRVLTIEGMDGVRHIRTEFYSNYNNGSDGTMLFPALRKLNLGSMPNLVEWMDVMEPATTTGLMVFTCLEELTIEGCSQLRSAPCHFSSLKKLDISDVRSTTFENIIGKLTTLTSIESTMAREIVSSMTEGIVSSMTGEIVNKIKAIQESLVRVEDLANKYGFAKLFLAESVDTNNKIIPNRETNSFLNHSEDIGQLTCLQTLRCFIVGQDAGHRIEELGCLNQLRGKLDLWNLEHVRDKEEARRANLGEKAKICMLRFHWAIQRKGNYENDEEVLEGLEPHRCLKSLTIDGFGGKKFPSWMLTSLDAWDGILQFGNLIEIEFRNCKKCEVLPTLGLLPHLRVLTIEGMDGVRHIGTEFYSNYNNGSDGTMLFPALRKLNLGSMPNLVEWMDVMEPATTTGLMVFTCLEELTIEGCSQLRSAPCHFSSLKKLDISDVRSTTFENIIGKLTTLTSIEVCNISELACLPEKLLQNNASLMSLMISGWADLESIVSHEDVWAFCTSLRSLKIERCWKLQIQGVPSHLQRLEICGCVILPTGLQSCTSLTLLTIQFCDKLKSIPNLGQLHSLTQLKIRYCDNLISIPDLRGLHSLIELQIWYCPKLTSLPEGLESLNRLKTLVIGEFCKELDDFPSLVSIEHLHASLQHLDLKGWPKLKSIPDNVQVLTALKSLYISDFDGMETLPEWLTKLSSLQTLRIFSCSKLKESYAIGGKERSKIAHIPNIMIWI